MLAECLVNYLGNLPGTSPIVTAFGEDIILAKNLFAYSSLPKPHNLIWVYSYSTGAPDLTDHGVFEARAVVNVRSFSYYIAVNTAKEIAKELNGKEISCENYIFRLRARSLEPTPVFMDQLMRIVYSVEFYGEFR